MGIQDCGSTFHFRRRKECRMALARMHEFKLLPNDAPVNRLSCGPRPARERGVGQVTRLPTRAVTRRLTAASSKPARLAARIVWPTTTNSWASSNGSPRTPRPRAPAGRRRPDCAARPASCRSDPRARCQAGRAAHDHNTVEWWTQFRAATAHDRNGAAVRARCCRRRRRGRWCWRRS